MKTYIVDIEALGNLSKVIVSANTIHEALEKVENITDFDNCWISETFEIDKDVLAISPCKNYFKGGY